MNHLSRRKDIISWLLILDVWIYHYIILLATWLYYLLSRRFHLVSKVYRLLSHLDTWCQKVWFMTRCFKVDWNEILMWKVWFLIGIFYHLIMTIDTSSRLILSRLVWKVYIMTDIGDWWRLASSIISSHIESMAT